MDRKQAQKIIGTFVAIDAQVNGSFYGTLEKIIAEPKKTWKGLVRIKGVLSLPKFQKEVDGMLLEHLLFKDNELVEVEGSKLKECEKHKMSKSFKESVIKAVETRNKEWEKDINLLKQKQTKLAGAISSFYSEDFSPKVAEKNVITYTFHHDGNDYILIDEAEERLELRDCPFTLNWEIKNKKMSGLYEDNGVFVSNDGYRYVPKEGAVFTIDRNQFDPYTILQNELEPAALQSLEKMLAHFGLTHEDLIECHNSLLTQLLETTGKKSFKGVNFLLYKGQAETIVVQHHYDRTLSNVATDLIYDRFEFTTEKGKRAISTYTNEYST
ncbi:hypothetical protein JCM9140_976 [Halalkalibacter wakoensis JCM 9140]|uniref:DUF2777 family protein n=1 Tax=Halalkalibacter wakoensis JCM 9140 TaxID=1236970 RepID=W4PZ50_9BACI|nr:DUF2777 family protein [Halalkalibacter wakoensis]GAE25007.1 hypothetical protein JCM9140_976 [Halalkalibacter wakoensis JCM 9140]